MSCLVRGIDRNGSIAIFKATPLNQIARENTIENFIKKNSN